jgi:hypothetical protein
VTHIAGAAAGGGVVVVVEVPVDVPGSVGVVAVLPGVVGVAVDVVGDVGVTVVEGTAVEPEGELGELGMGGAPLDGSPGLLPPPHAAATTNIIAANNCVR